MLCLDDIEKNRIIKDHGFSPLQILEKLDKEMKLLADKKQKIIDSHKNLLYIMNKRIEAKKRNNEKLRLEIEKRKESCVKMVRIMNASIRFDIDNSALH
jgi:hypothetical protein